MRAADRQDARPQPARGTEDGSIEPSRRHHRRSGQDHARELDPDDTSSKGREMPTVRPNRTSSKAAHRDHWLGSEEHPPPARDRPRRWSVYPERVQPLAGPLVVRDLQGGCAAYALAGAGCAFVDGSSLGHELSDPHRLIEPRLAKLCSKRRAGEWLKSSL